MKAIVNEKPEQDKEQEYPYIGVCMQSGIPEYVLFANPKCGTTLNLNKYKQWNVGYYCETWREEWFIPFTGEIVMSNS